MFNILLKLVKQLYPTGRAFKMFLDSEFEKLSRGILLSQERFINDARSILFSIIADNDNFTTDDASDWERRLGMPDNSLADLEDRKAAIIRKLNAPGINPAKGHYLYIQTQLQLANFNVYIYENIPATDPVSAGWPSTITPLQYGNGSQYGLTVQYGGNLTNKIVNHIDESKDLLFNLGGTYACTFFVGGATYGSIANVPAVRKNEFRELLLKLKQTQTAGLLYINYV